METKVVVAENDKILKLSFLPNRLQVSFPATGSTNSFGCGLRIDPDRVSIGKNFMQPN